MTITPHLYLTLTRPDAIAECWEGVSTELYKRLWESMANIPKYNGETPPEPDVQALHNVWDFFTDEEKTELNRLAEVERQRIKTLMGRD